MDIVKMSGKGQLVVPKDIRDILGLETEDMFLAYGADDYIVFKRVKLKSLQKEFDDIVKVTSRILEEGGVTEDVVMEEVKSERKKRKVKNNL